MAGRFIWVEERLGSIPNSPIFLLSFFFSSLLFSLLLETTKSIPYTLRGIDFTNPIVR